MHNSLERLADHFACYNVRHSSGLHPRVEQHILGGSASRAYSAAILKACVPTSAFTRYVHASAHTFNIEHSFAGTCFKISLKCGYLKTRDATSAFVKTVIAMLTTTDERRGAGRVGQSMACTCYRVSTLSCYRSFAKHCPNKTFMMQLPNNSFMKQFQIKILMK